MDKIEFLNQPPKEIKILGNTGIEYIPIGLKENLLDELTGYSWSTRDFKFQVIKAANYWFADASVLVDFGDGTTINGAISFPISSKDENMDYSGTALSHCISNACTRKGIVFGRGLNNRLHTGETSIPVASKEVIETDTIIDAKLNDLKAALEKCASKQEAELLFADNPEFKYNIECKQIINSKLN